MRESTVYSRQFVQLWIGSLFFSSSFQLFLTTLPLYAIQLGARESEIGLIIGLFALAAFVVRPIVGWQLDRGRRVPLLVLGAAIFAISSGAYAFATSVGALLAIRAFHGLGMSSFTTAGQTLVADVAPLNRRGEAMSVFTVSVTLAAGLAPAAGMALLLAFGFTPLFAIACGLATLATLLVALIREPLRSASRPSRLKLFNTSALGPGVVMMTLMFAYGATASFIPIYALQRGLENPGFFFGVTAGCMVLSQVIGGPISDRFGRLASIVPGLLLTGAGVATVAFVSGWWLLLAAAVYGLGAGSVQPSLFALSTDGAKEQERGSALATTGMFLEVGIGGGAILAGLLAERIGLSSMFLATATLPLAGAIIAVAPSLMSRAQRTRA